MNVQDFIKAAFTMSVEQWSAVAFVAALVAAASNLFYRRSLSIKDSSVSMLEMQVKDKDSEISRLKAEIAEYTDDIRRPGPPPVDRIPKGQIPDGEMVS